MAGSASSSASAGQQNPGGSINVNSPGAIVLAIIVVGLIVAFSLRKA
jgi:hypothetical protein